MMKSSRNHLFPGVTSICCIFAYSILKYPKPETRILYDYSHPEVDDPQVYNYRPSEVILPARIAKNDEPIQQQRLQNGNRRFSLYKFILGKRHTRDLLSRLAAHFRDNDLGVKDMTESKRAAPLPRVGLWRLMNPRRPYRLSDIIFDRNRFLYLRRKTKF